MNNDVHFVNSLYGQSNEKPSKKMDILFFTIILFIITSITWAYFAEIDELTRGVGKVVPANKIQTIQSLDGGIISEILVKEGEIVKMNQALMKIETVRFEASLEENKERYLSLLAKKQRLKTQIKYKPERRIPKINFSKELNNGKNNYTKTETKILKNKIAQLNSSIKTLRYQLYQKRQELKEIVSKEVQLRESLNLLKQQKYTITKLVRSGSKSNLELLKIKSEYNKARGELKNALITIPKSKLAIQEAKSKIKERTDDFIFKTSEKLQETETELQKVKARLVSDNDKLKKTIVRSSVNGIIKQIHINTIGGVVKSADKLIEIVPNSEFLLIEAKIDPKDIAFINPTQKVIIKLTAYDFSIYGGLKGKIIEISADSIKDKDSKEGKTYYKVMVKANKNFLERNGKKYPIIPGMVTSVDIVTGKKTILNFILKPILKTKQGALHER